MVIDNLRETAKKNPEPWAPAASTTTSETENSKRSFLPWAQTSSKVSKVDSKKSKASNGSHSSSFGRRLSAVEDGSEFGLRSSIGSGKMIAKLGLQDEVELQTENDLAVRRAIEKNRPQSHETRWQRWRKHLKKTTQFHQELVKKGKKVVYEVNEKDELISKIIYHRYPLTRRIVTNRRTEYFITLLIVANCVIIGWQAGFDAEPTGSTKTINIVIEQSFTFLFFTELMSRVLVYNWTFFFCSDNHLDIFLVTLSVLNTWILGPLNIQADFLRKASVLRILRLVRIAKSYRTQFKEMWQLLRGIVDSLETLIWTYVMTACVLYFFGIVATILFTQMGAFDAHEEAKELAEENFSDVLTSMYTLFQVMTLDSWNGVCRELALVHGWVDLFYIVFISIAVFLLMNLITAVIVDKAEMASKDDKAELLAEKEKKKEEAIKEISDVFQEIDEDGSGMINKEELANAWKRRKVREKFRMMEISKKDLRTLWTALTGNSKDDNASLSMEEFIGGCRKLKGEAKAKDILKLYREVRILEESIKEMEALSDYFATTGRNIKSKLHTTFKEMDAVRRTLLRVKEVARLAAKSQPLSAFTEKVDEDDM